MVKREVRKEEPQNNLLLVEGKMINMSFGAY